MQYSVAFASEVDSWRWAKRAEELGYHAAWFYDTQLLNPDVFICMALAAHETSRIRLGTGVLVPSNRIAPVTANALASLNRLAPGRIDFGVGTGFTARRTMGQGALKLSETSEYINVVQAMLRGEIAQWRGDDGDHKVRFLDPDLGLINIDDEIPLWFSAFGPRAKATVAQLQAGWLNFASANTQPAIEHMRDVWRQAGHPDDTLRTNLFFLGAVLTGNEAEDEERLMAQAAPSTAVIFHNMADEVGAMSMGGGSGSLSDPMSNLFAQYMQHHDTYEPSDARYLSNHKGHLMYVREEETHLSPELVKATTMSGTHDELVVRLREIERQGYEQVTIQLVHGHESAIEEWAEVFKAV